MPPESPDAEAIFHRAIQLPTPQERAAYLAGACGDHPALRQRVENLINAHEDASRLLPTDPAHASLTLPDRPLAEGPGTVIDRYKLLQKIGEGGFGVVYMAEQQQPVVRRLALKIIKPGMDTRQVIARFEAERQALALMDHPNIAKVLDAGATTTGRPYFVMELVQGVPITEFCDQNHLTAKERLTLFLDVCAAAQHAHQKGIIHRDLKPSNILITLLGDQPHPKIIDFGIAKATQHRLTEKTLFTHFAQFIGTPAYMSPEQATMSGFDIDARSDVYSLGVLLYELLSGKTPFDTRELLEAGYEEVCRRIREVEPPKPSTRLSTLEDQERTTIAKQRGAQPAQLGRLIRGELDWIVMKALEKDRRRRYDSAAAFADDIRRHLENRPVVAASPGPLYRLRKFARRHRRLALTGAAALVVATVGLAANLLQARKTRQAEERAREATAIARAARAAEATLRDESALTASRSQLEVILAGRDDHPAEGGLLSPDGSRLAFTDWGLTGGPLVVRELPSGTERILKRPPAIPTAFEFGLVIGGAIGAWSPDSQRLCLPWFINRKSELWIIPVSGEPRVLVPDPPESGYLPEDWSPDGRFVLCAFQRTNGPVSALTVVSVSDGSVRDLHCDGTHARFSPDSRRLVYEGVGTNAFNLFLYDLESGLSRQLTHHPEKDQAPVWSTDGRYVVFSSHRRESWDLWALEVADGRARGGPFLIRSGIQACSKTTHPGGALTLYGGLSLLDPAYAPVPSDGPIPPVPPQRFTGINYGANLFIGWHPDGRQIAYLRNIYDADRQQVVTRSLADGSERAYPTGFYAREAFWHPDGRSIVLMRRAVALLDLESGQVRTATTNLAKLINTLLTDRTVAAADFHPQGWDRRTGELLVRVGLAMGLRATPAAQIGHPHQTRHFAVDLATSRIREVTLPARHGQPEFQATAPDAAHVAWVVEHGRRLLVAAPDLANPRELLAYPPEDRRWIGNPRWSPDGTRIAVAVVPQARPKAPPFELHVINLATGEDHTLELDHRTPSTWNGFCHWFPDGRQLGFTLQDQIHEISLLKNVDRLIAESAAQAGPPEL